MLEGSLSDASVAGLLQLLCHETQKSYSIQIRRMGQVCNVFVSKGEVASVTFGILEGVEALSEVLFWDEGEFWVERFDTAGETALFEKERNLNIKFDSPTSLAYYCSFLKQNNVGLHTEIVPSANFGTQEWQEMLTREPLLKDDFTVIGWITDGRTMRQAMVELNLDLKSALSSLYRLLATRSVDVVRPLIADAQVAEDIKNSSDNLPVQRRVRKTQDVELKKGVGAMIGVDTQEIPALPSEEGDTSINQSNTHEDIKKDGAKKLVELAVKTQAPNTVSGLTRDEVKKPVLSASAIEKNQGDEKFVDENGDEFDPRLTDLLPIVSIDIERLLNSNFSVTKEGKERLEDDELHELVRQVLIDTTNGKTLVAVLTDSSLTAASVLATYRYCQEEKLISHYDPVISLTIELVMAKMELEQYLLQRRRITGDQLQDLITIAGRQGIGLDKLLVGAGYLLPVDMDRLKQEQDRFSSK
ncbi:MAG: DUF4388 domain-containing protein [Candidatus Melainabacteria bacterium]|nr:MAG: DUF4388 domain-containing protein [Candidatus Melainabacteria bacterium]